MSQHRIEPRFLPAGDAGIVIEFGDAIDPGINTLVLSLDAAINAAGIAGVIETVPTYRSLLIQIDPLVFDVEQFSGQIRALLHGLDAQSVKGRRWRVPVVYGGDFGIDLEDVAARHGLTPHQVIDTHCAAVYRVYMIGFMPGFTYLGGLDQALATPRRPDPRTMTPAGTVSIGGIQALVAGAAMPSGWHLLGRTPARTFMTQRDPVVLFAPGDEIVFVPIEARHWDTLDRDAAAGAPIAELIAA
jgi:KipI family sensor histidine kinase inhibitor